jgi:hypothetical protein
MILCSSPHPAPAALPHIAWLLPLQSIKSNSLQLVLFPQVLFSFFRQTVLCVDTAAPALKKRKKKHALSAPDGKPPGQRQ